MTVTRASEPSASRRPGMLGEALSRLFMKHATVISSELLSPGFHLITLESLQFRGVAWTPGQKLQIAIGSVFVARTYTAIEWDRVKGQTQVIAYAHGDGPGSNWVRGVKAGDTCEVFGPRTSLDVKGLRCPAVVFGDETSLGLAATISRQFESGPVEYLIEADFAEATQAVLKRFDVNKAELFSRRSNDEHLREIEQQLVASAAAGATFVLTGKATSIQRLRRVLKSLDVPSVHMMTKAYWAPGKTGLD